MLSQNAVFAADLSDLSPVTGWKQEAPGVWTAAVGDAGRERSYTSLAAEPPCLEALAERAEVAFPFDGTPILGLKSVDHTVLVRVPAAPEERLYGFGLQFDGLRKAGTVLTLNVDHWAKGGGRTHAPVPFYISSRGYGVFFNTARFLKVYVRVGNRKDAPNLPPRVDRNPPPDDEQSGPWQAVPPGDAVEAQVRGEGLDLVVIAGESLLDVVCRYNLYCGGGAMPPLWGLGFWHRVPATFNAEQTRAEVAEFEERDFPLEVVGLEPGWMTKSYPCTFEWQKKRFPDPEGFVGELLDRGIRLNLWENPYLHPESRIFDRMYPLSGSHLVWLGIVPDYTLPEARALLVEQHAEDHLRIGVSGYKIDEVDGYDRWLWPDHATFPSGTPAETMRQAYGLMMQRMLYRDLFKANNRRTYGLVRASNGAASGYPFVIYSDSYSHVQYITGLSAASLCGILWTPEARQARDDREWLNRIQTVCFSPMAKLNAWSSGKKPWSYPGVTDAVREVVRLRMRLLPYLYTAFADYHRHGIPPIRAMILEGPGVTADPTRVEGKLDGVRDPYAEGWIVERNDQFMFGPSILVAPFYERQATRREVRLPPGAWRDFYSGRSVGGGKTVKVEADQGRIPLFVKEGAVIPLLTKPVRRTEEAYGHPLEVRIYGESVGSFDLYEDDGKTFDYQRGAYRIRRIVVEPDEDGTWKASEQVIREGAPPLFGPVQSVQQMNP